MFIMPRKPQRSNEFRDLQFFYSIQSLFQINENHALESTTVVRVSVLHSQYLGLHAEEKTKTSEGILKFSKISQLYFSLNYNCTILTDVGEFWNSNRETFVFFTVKINREHGKLSL